MKTSNRVHRKGGKRKGFPQAQTQRSQKAKPRTVALQFLDENGQEAARVKLNKDTFSKLQAAAKQAGVPIDQFMLAGLESQLRQVETQSQCAAEQGKGRDHGVILKITRPNGEEWARVDLTIDAFAELEKAARICGQSVPQFVWEAMVWKMVTDRSKILETLNRSFDIIRGREAQLFALLSFDDTLGKVLQYICRWEKMAVLKFCHDSVLAFMHASLDDMQSFATGRIPAGHARRLEASDLKAECAWARQFYSQVKLLMDREDRRAA